MNTVSHGQLVKPNDQSFTNKWSEKWLRWTKFYYTSFQLGIWVSFGMTCDHLCQTY